jgi:hypothetical protein
VKVQLAIQLNQGFGENAGQLGNTHLCAGYAHALQTLGNLPRRVDAFTTKRLKACHEYFQNVLQLASWHLFRVPKFQSLKK